MPIATRTASTTWQGTLKDGSGTLASQSGTLDSEEVTWASRTHSPDGKTSPEELCAAAHAACFSMALALKLADHGAQAQQLDVRADVTLDDIDGVPTIVSSALTVDAEIPDWDGDFQAVIAEAGDLCPVSRLYAGAKITIVAHRHDPTA